MAELEILALSGSLRKASHNSALVRAAVGLAPEGMRIVVYDGVGELPLYNADLDVVPALPPVAELRSRIHAADGLLIATPEYNYSIPAPLKNAIDWASRAPEGVPALRHKPVALMGAAPGNFGTVRAQLALRQSFLWTDARVVVKPEVHVFRAAERFNDRGELSDDDTKALIADLLAALARLIRLHQAQQL